MSIDRASAVLHEPFIRKLEHYVQLTPNDYAILRAMGGPMEEVHANQEIVAEGNPPRSPFIMLEGIACRSRVLSNGNRQILTFLLPGDICDPHVFLLRTMDHSITTLTNVKFSGLASSEILKVTTRRPRISAALWWSTQQEESMLRERIVALGRRSAAGRMAYLLCELVWRQQAVGYEQDGAFFLPITQVELGDALGLTAVHVNRVLQRFRREKLVTLHRSRLELHDIPKLQQIGQFTSDYLHFGSAPDEVQRYLASFPD